MCWATARSRRRPTQGLPFSSTAAPPERGGAHLPNQVFVAKDAPRARYWRAERTASSDSPMPSRPMRRSPDRRRSLVWSPGPRRTRTAWASRTSPSTTPPRHAVAVRPHPDWRRLDPLFVIEYPASVDGSTNAATSPTLRPCLDGKLWIYSVGGDGRVRRRQWSTDRLAPSPPAPPSTAWPTPHRRQRRRESSSHCVT